jgi:hypothetical protein
VLPSARKGIEFALGSRLLVALTGVASVDAVVGTAEDTFEDRCRAAHPATPRAVVRLVAKKVRRVFLERVSFGCIRTSS